MDGPLRTVENVEAVPSVLQKNMGRENLSEAKVAEREGKDGVRFGTGWRGGYRSKERCWGWDRGLLRGSLPSEALSPSF